MKIARYLLIAVLLLSLSTTVGIKSADAQAALASQCSGFQLQNTTGSTAHMTVDFYSISAATGIPAYSFSLPDLGANKSSSYYVPSYSGFSTVTPGSYSIVVSSDQPLMSLVNQATCVGSTPYVLATYAGLSSGDIGLSVYVSYVLSRAYAANWSSTLTIQNAGAADTTVDVDFYTPGNPTSVQNFSRTVKSGDSWFIDLSSGTYATAPLLNFRGSAKIVSGTSAVAVVETHFPGAGNMLLASNGSPDTLGSQKLIAPQVVKAYTGFTSGLTIFNPNGTSTDISIDYIASGATSPTYTQTATIAANSTLIQYLGSLTPLPAPFNGTAIVTVTSGVNEIFGVADIASSKLAATMNMITTESAATTLYLPQITRAYSNFNSGWQVVNNSSNELGLTIEYWDATDVTPSLTEYKTLAANSAITNYVGAASYAGTLGSGWNGGVIIKVTSGTGTIVGQANFVGLSGDAFSMYGAFPASS